MSMTTFFRSKLDKRTRDRLAEVRDLPIIKRLSAIKARARGLSRCGGERETVVTPSVRMAEMVARVDAEAVPS